MANREAVRKILYEEPSCCKSRRGSRNFLLLTQLCLGEAQVDNYGRNCPYFGYCDDCHLLQSNKGVGGSTYLCAMRVLSHGTAMGVQKR